ncbi:MAG TPA: DUF4382 domain-containing protein [Bdellovibrio sp.]|nr:DUF4382 domain-containing protein [Bdellovibrio sp.]
MMTHKNFAAALALLGMTTLMANCAPKTGATNSTETPSQTSQSAGSSASGKNMKLSVTSVSNPNLQNLFLNISRVDMLLSNGSQNALVNVANNLGTVDLQSLQNGLTSQLANITLPTGFNLQQINLVLGQTGNTAVDKNGNQCQLQIPGSLGNILPLSFGQGLNISNNSFFSLLMGIDSQSAITSLGNGSCAFNPTTGLASAYKFDLSGLLGSLTGGTLTNGSVAGLSNPMDILATIFPQLGQTSTSTTGATSGLSGLLGSLLGGMTGGSSSSSAGSLLGALTGLTGATGTTASNNPASMITTLLSGLLSNGGIANPNGALSNGQVSLPIDLSTGNFATGSGVGSLISALLQNQVQNNTSTTSGINFGSMNNPLALLQLLPLLGVH